MSAAALLVFGACGGSAAADRGEPVSATTAPPSAAGVGTTTAVTSPIEGPGPCGTADAPPAAYEHVIWVWMENHRADQVLGTAEAPYENALAQRCGHATNYVQAGVPSLPNYIAATSGDTWGIARNDPPTKWVLTVDNIFRQVRDSDRRAMSFAEAMPANCSLSDSGTYAVRHNPATYYKGRDDRSACQRDNVPLGTLSEGAFHDALSGDSLPAFSFVTPDLCHDTHDCSVATGDAWLADFLPTIFDSAAYRRGGTAVFLVWDEDSPMPFIAMAPSVPKGTVLEDKVDHYALLRTTEEMLGLSEFLGQAADAPSMREAFNL